MLTALAVALVVLVVTGVWLWFRYAPTAAGAWPGVKHRSPTWVQTTHRTTGDVSVVLALAALVLMVGQRIRTAERGVVAGLAVLVTATASSFTGYLLPWDQLALWAVTVGTDIRGVQTTFQSNVKYVLLGTREVSPNTYRFWAITHVVLGLLVGVAVLLGWMRTRRSRAISLSSPTIPEPAPEPAA